MTEKPVTVYARKRYNRTGIQLMAGRRYSMTASGEWFDREFPYGPDGGPAGNFFQKIFEWARRRRTEPWFVLTGTIDEDNATAFRIGSELEGYKATKSGELTCYANDVWLAYGNNSGSVSMSVRQID
jgi:hypothetical protein